jgi:hypothetical protein
MLVLQNIIVSSSWFDQVRHKGDQVLCSQDSDPSADVSVKLEQG